MVDQEQGETTQVAGGQGGQSAIPGGGNGLSGTNTNVVYKLLAPPSQSSKAIPESAGNPKKLHRAPTLNSNVNSPYLPSQTLNNISESPMLPPGNISLNTNNNTNLNNYNYTNTITDLSQITQQQSEVGQALLAH